MQEALDASHTLNLGHQWKLHQWLMHVNRNET